MNTISIIIKKLRRFKGYTQSEMANRLHLSSKAYQKIENGATKLDVDRLTQIAMILEVSLIDLINAESNVGKAYLSGQTRISNKDPTTESAITVSEKRLLHIIIDAKGKEITSLQEAILS